MSPLYFAVPDLHGRADLLELAIARITAMGGGTVVFLGDYTDRGPDSRRVVEILMAGPPAGQKWICLGGNHDQMAFCCYTGLVSRSFWHQHGGLATLASYGQVIPREHLEWLRNLQVMHVTEHHVFVHACIDPLRPLDDQDEDTVKWHRYGKGEPGGLETHHVIHGHTITKSGEPEDYPGRTALDTGAFARGRLHIAVINPDKPGPPERYVWVQA